MARKILPFISRGAKAAPDGDGGQILDHGVLGNLNYEIYDRGVIHILSDKPGLIFKKGCVEFEDALESLCLEDMKDGNRKVIQGSGDNDNLVFICENGDITLKIEKRTFSTVEKLRGIIATAKSKVA